MKMDDLSILDILSVLLRHRKIILGTLLASLFLSVCAVLFIPRNYLKGIDNDYSLSGLAQLDSTPGVQTFVDSRTLDNYIVRTITDPGIFIGALKSAKIQTYAGININNFDKTILHNKNGLLRVEKEQEGYNLILKVSKSFDFDSFSIGMITLSNKRMEELLIPYAEEKIWEFENITLRDFPEAPYEERFSKSYNRYLAASGFLVRKYPSLTMLQSSYTLMETALEDDLRTIIMRKALVLSFFAFVLSVFFAFLLDWVTRNREKV